MLKVGQRIKLSDGIYRVKEVDSFKAKVVQEVTEIREFTTRFDKIISIKAKPKIRYISPNAELKILPDKPLTSKPAKKLKLPSDKIKIVKKTKPITKSKPVVKPKQVAKKKKNAPAKKTKQVIVKKITKPVEKLKQVPSKKTTAPLKKIKKVAAPLKNTSVKKSKLVIEPQKNEPDKFGQFSLF